LIVVLDASIVISAALKAESVPEKALRRAITRPDRLILSQDVVAEYQEVMCRPKFDRLIGAERRSVLLNLLTLSAEMIEPIEIIRECSDPGDDKYLTLAAAGGADVIVTGDVRHLLAMDPWRGIRILRPLDFLAQN